MLSDERLQEIRENGCNCPSATDLLAEVTKLRAELAGRDAEAMNLRAEVERLRNVPTQQLADISRSMGVSMEEAAAAWQRATGHES